MAHTCEYLRKSTKTVESAKLDEVCGNWRVAVRPAKASLSHPGATSPVGSLRRRSSHIKIGESCSNLARIDGKGGNFDETMRNLHNF